MGKLNGEFNYMREVNHGAIFVSIATIVSAIYAFYSYSKMGVSLDYLLAIPFVLPIVLIVPLVMWAQVEGNHVIDFAIIITMLVSAYVAVRLHNTMDIYLGYLVAIPSALLYVFLLLKSLDKDSADNKAGNKSGNTNVKSGDPNVQGLDPDIQSWDPTVLGTQNLSKMTPKKAFKQYLKYKKRLQREKFINMDATGAKIIGPGLFNFLDFACSQGNWEAIFIQGCIFQSGFGGAIPDEHTAKQIFEDVVNHLENELAVKKHLSRADRKLLKKAKQRLDSLNSEQRQRNNFLAQHFNFQNSISKLKSSKIQTP